MKKAIIVLSLLVLVSGCTIGDNSNNITEKNASENLNYYNDSEVTSRINDIKNGAAPKVKIDSKNIESNQSKENKQMIMENQNQQTKSVKTDGEIKDYALIETNMGNIKIGLYSDDSPITVNNFKKYISDEFYSGTIFHRVMDGFMVQGGGFDKKGNQKQTLEPIKNEANNGIDNKRGTLAMARTMVVDSATSQFFINLISNDFLNYKDDSNYGYAVFGEVVEGMDVVDNIAKVETGNSGGHQDWPIKDVEIKSIKMINK